ncbi:31473_t:CDS:2 [Gigaspora margarita]|uniref:31473_t:CDS:1 n=1 Tax=Gigaspora margarita TaxID=4874 RepID=A0ABN7UMY4_GIGMA|nr:31473_t:CDS:2 [Gigaspora margarita]
MQTEQQLEYRKNELKKRQACHKCYIKGKDNTNQNEQINEEDSI